jgi:hypothetical protein
MLDGMLDMKVKKRVNVMERDGWSDNIVELLTLYCHWGCNRSVEAGGKICVFISLMFRSGIYELCNVTCGTGWQH